MLLLPFVRGHALVVIFLYLLIANIIDEVFVVSLLLHIVKSG